MKPHANAEVITETHLEEGGQEDGKVLHKVLVLVGAALVGGWDIGARRQDAAQLPNPHLEETLKVGVVLRAHLQPRHLPKKKKILHCSANGRLHLHLKKHGYWRDYVIWKANRGMCFVEDILLHGVVISKDIFLVG